MVNALKIIHNLIISDNQELNFMKITNLVKIIHTKKPQPAKLKLVLCISLGLIVFILFKFISRQFFLI
jgi:hypothetical protein